MSSRLFTAVVSTIHCCRLDHSLLLSRPFTAVVSTIHHCCLDYSPLAPRLFTTGASTFALALPFLTGLLAFLLCHRDLPPLSSRPTPAVISNRRERSHAVIIRPKKGIPGVMRFLAPLRNDSGGSVMTFALPGTARFLAPLRNDSGGGIMAFALPGTARFLAPLRNDSGGGFMAFALPGTARFLAPLRNDSGGGFMTFALPGTTNTVASTYPRIRLDQPPLSSRPASAVIATCPRCHRDLPPLSSRTAGRDLMQPLSALRKASSASRDFSLRFEMTAGEALCPSPYRE